MFLLVTSFLAGILTVFAPCVLILLPVIVGNSLAKDTDNKSDEWKPYIISISLGISVLLFTFLLKASTVLIGIDPQVWKSVSGGIVIILGLSLLFPLLWARISSKIGLEHSSNALLATASKRSGIVGYILTGAALGPVFSACSPIYAVILATILPVNFALGFVYMTLYALGLTLTLLAIALVGRRLTSKVTWTAKPNGWFRRGLAILLILVGFAVITGFDKSVQTWILIHVPINSTKLEEKLVLSSNMENSEPTRNLKSVLNVNKPYGAPEIRGITDWINSQPQTLANLKGKVILVDFWTYSCINCLRTQPYLNVWHDKYNDDGLVILGVHAPEFAFEKVPANVRNAVLKSKIKYPVALDNDFSTWQAYDNQFWPAKYLIDKDGKVRYTHFGEGDYVESELAIQTLLAESGHTVSDILEQRAANDQSENARTPETYLGYERGERFANAKQLKADQFTSYTIKNMPSSDEWTIGGRWRIDGKQSFTGSNGAKLGITFNAKEVYLVMDGPADAVVSLKLNNKPVTASVSGGTDVGSDGLIRLDGARLYRLVNLPQFTRNAVLEITLPSDVSVNAFTFGS